MMNRLVATGALLLLVGCSARSSEGAAEEEVAPEEPAREPAPQQVAAPEPLPMGKDQLTGYAYSRGPGREAFREAVAALHRGDWEALDAAARQALLADPGHLEAHWYLALNLARIGRHDEVIAPLSAAVAGDWMRWAEPSVEDETLREFLATPHGQAWLELRDTYAETFRAALGDALLVVGRRGKPWQPGRTGHTEVNHRSEIYAYLPASGRFLRVSRTDGSLVGFVRAPSGREIAFAGYRKVFLDDDGGGHIRQLHIGTVDLERARPSRGEVVIDDVAAADLFYGGQPPQPMIRVQRSGGSGEAEVLVLDPDAGTASPVEDPVAIGDALRVEIGTVALRRSAIPDVAADWGADGVAGAFRLLNTKKTITLPPGESAVRDSMRWSPSQTRLALSTAPQNRCADEAAERAATLHVVEAATGRLRAVGRSEGALGAIWVDDARLAYVDATGPEPSVRLVDVVSGGELVHLETPGGVATQWLGSAAPCRPVPGQEDSGGDPEDDR